MRPKPKINILIFQYFLGRPKPVTQLTSFSRRGKAALTQKGETAPLVV